MKLVFDLEGDDLRHKVTKVWCLVGYDLDSKATFVATKYEDIRDILNKADELIGHNIIGYDLPALKKLGIYVPHRKQKITDTLVLSKLLYPDRKAPKGMSGKPKPHSVEAWGYRFGMQKPEHEDWSQFSPEMLNRCKEDVKIQVRIYRHLMSKEWGNWDWSFASYIEHRVAEIITQQEDNGFKFNKELALDHLSWLDKEINRLDNLVSKKLSLEVVNYGPVNKPFKKDGTYSKMAEDWLGSLNPNSYYTSSCISGSFSRICWSEPDLGSRQKITKQLLRLGWVPETFTDKGSPKLTVESKPCPSLGKIAKEEGKWIADRFIYSHRRSQIKGWLDALRPDGRITAGANPLGANTGRMTHNVIVNVPKAAEQVKFGRQMRELFTVEGYGHSDYILCGHDADGLELGILGHHMGDEDFIKAVDEGDKDKGTDVHTLNQKLAGLETRDDAKTLAYAIVYGAGDAKLGKLKGGTATAGKALRKQFLENLPALESFIKFLKLQAKNGYVIGRDGRKIFLRRDAVTGKVLDHKALNTQIQGDGAIIMKLSMIYLDIMIKNRQLDVKKVIDQHDESQAEVLKKHSKKYMELSCKSVVKSGQRLNLKCPLKASAQSGKNWAKTH